jgi:hypothetical protein
MAKKRASSSNMQKHELVYPFSRHRAGSSMTKMLEFDLSDGGFWPRGVWMWVLNELAIIRWMKIIATNFPDIPCHIIQTITVRRKRTNRRSGMITVPSRIFSGESTLETIR